MTAIPEKKVKKKHPVRRVILILLLIVLLAGAAYLGYQVLRAKYTVVYQGYRVSTGNLTDSLSFDTSVQLIHSQTYTASASAKVKKLYVQEGDAVKEGDTLMSLSNGERIKADFDGKVNVFFVEEGDEVQAGAQLVQLADFNHIRMYISTDEYNINKINVGDSCMVTLTASGATYPATITSINHVGMTTRTVAVYTANIDLEVENDVYPGMQATVTIPQVLAENALLVSRDGISFTDNNQAFVYLQQEDGTMVETEVTLGEYNDNYAEVTSGITADDTVYAKVETETTAAGLFASMMSNMSIGGGSTGGTGRGSRTGGWSGGGGNGGNWNRQ